MIGKDRQALVRVETLYLETSILGYLTARSTPNPIVTANIEVTKEWWRSRRSAFEIYVSRAVLNEVSRGDAEMAALRLDFIRGFRLLGIDRSVEELAARFLLETNLPPKAEIDALHIATATVHRMNYLLTWNCKHIANATIGRKLRQISLDLGYELPIICTPYELLAE
ncbi:type II toxin-antitoxin system VapC family toxin [Pannus brasiliensis CCIBt3594]|uniref:Type II toxin-antitoxin system VapC family toxin n=1 Tax=Pannus brasiliensis CCIBt3594 TaxID=1427578 RepID=A0AAW9QZJ5_9CHRO